MRHQAEIRTRRVYRAARLRRLGFESYRDYLRSPHWRDVKARYRQSDLPQACVCGEPDVHLHHMTYARVGRERLTDLTPLCGRCHSMVHALEQRGDVALDLQGLFDEGRAAEGRVLLERLVAEQEHARRERLAVLQREVLDLPYATRLLRVAREARFRRHIDITSELRLLNAMARRAIGDEKLTRQLRRIEERVYGWTGWA